MAALTAADWTITQDAGSPRIQPGTPAKRVATGKMALPGTSTYPTQGVPLPTAAALGFVREMTSLQIVGVDSHPTTNFTPSVDLVTGTLQLFDGAATPAEMSNATAPGPIAWHFRAEGW